MVDSLGKTSRTRPSGGAVFIAVASTIFAVLAVLVRSGKTAKMDREVTLKLQAQKAPWFSRLMHAVSWAGFPPQSRILPLVIPAAVSVIWSPMKGLVQLAGWGTSILSGITKFLMKRPRPNGPEFNITKARIGGTSFPSGHVINYVGIYGTLAFLANRTIRPKALRRVVVGGLASLIALVGPSRIYLGHHWFSDVFASYLLGSSYLVALTSLYRRVTGSKSVK